MSSKGLIIFAGEAFRLGGQCTRDIGSDASFPAQIQACYSHTELIEHLRKQSCEIDVFISSYNTQFNDQLFAMYKDAIIGSIMYDERIGINNLFHNAFKAIHNTSIYDFICFIRIDLFLKRHFMDVFDCSWNTLRVPSICFKPCHKSGGHPRINDTMLFLPKNYYNVIPFIQIGHDLWLHLMNNTELGYSDIDTMIHTYHDSDSQKDFNPLYKIVNRPECQTVGTTELFDKFSNEYDSKQNINL